MREGFLPAGSVALREASSVSNYPENSDYMHHRDTPQGVRQNMDAQTTPVQENPMLDQGYEEMTITPVEIAGDVKITSPAMGYAQCNSLGSANQVVLILPQDPLRRNALVLAVDNDVYLCSSKETAQAAAGVTTSSAGFYLPKSILMAVPSKGAVWAAITTSSGTSRVSVFVARDE